MDGETWGVAAMDVASGARELQARHDRLAGRPFAPPPPPVGRVEADQVAAVARTSGFVAVPAELAIDLITDLAAAGLAVLPAAPSSAPEAGAVVYAPDRPMAVLLAEHPRTLSARAARQRMLRELTADPGGRPGA